jgi:hypothetical protein
MEIKEIDYKSSENAINHVADYSRVYQHLRRIRHFLGKSVFISLEKRVAFDAEEDEHRQ